MTRQEYIDAIRARHSCRSFKDLDPQKRDKIAELAGHSPHLKPIMLDSDGRIGTYGVIRGSKVAVAVIAGEPPALTRQAALDAEDFLLQCTNLGLGTCWLGGTFKVSGTGHDKQIPAIIVVGEPKDKPTLVDSLMRRFAKSTSRKPFDELFRPVSPECDITPLRLPLEMMRLAPSACNAQPWRACVDKSVNIHFYCVTDNKYSDLDMGIAVCHFSLTAPAGEFYDAPAAPLTIFPAARYVCSWH